MNLRCLPKLSILSLLALGLLAPSAVRATELVANGDFDLNSPPGAETAPEDWTFVPAAVGSDFVVNAGQGLGAYSAPNSANFGSTSSFPDELYQDLSTVAGESYTITFYLGHPFTDDANSFVVDFGSDQLLDLVDASTFGYTEYSYTAVATGSSTQLAFYGNEVDSWYELDNVSVTNASVIPEPDTFYLLATGLVGLGGLIRRKLMA